MIIKVFLGISVILTAFEEKVRSILLITERDFSKWPGLLQGVK